MIALEKIKQSRIPREPYPLDPILIETQYLSVEGIHITADDSAG